MRPPVRATYRLQLRNGVTFAEAAALAPQLARAGISHVYASPIFRAVAGSTHGYDVADHTVIDPALGGEAGFFAFSSALKAHGLGLILDIVPNHMAAHSDNPWWRDVLRHGPSSRYARHFDIDWTAQTLTLPILGKPYGEALADGDMARATHPEWGEGLAVAGQHLPLAPGTEHLSDVHACHEAQPYRVTHWRLARDGLTYRRFFEIAGLVGVRVEEPHVFDDVHRLVQTLVEDGHVSGLRVDHVDGLADPAAYLTRLSTLGVPVWVEKILGEDEGLPPWPVVGTTGYEFMAALHAAFVDEAGLAHLSAAYDAIAPAAYGAMEAAAKHRIATVNLAGEFASLETMARALFASDMSARDHGPDTIRRGLIALSCALPVYRTYITGTPSEADRGHVEAARLAAAIGNLDERRVVDDLAALIVRGGAEEAPFVARWQQTTGPLMAKAVEDTLFFRHHRLIALNEVGSHPSAPLRVHNLDKALASPGLATTQTHDTKRGPDARARLYQLTHPDAARWWDTFWPTVGGGVSPSWQWALAQMWLGALPLDHDPTFKARFCAAVEKSAREAKEDTSWTRHNLAFESMLRA
ncbi:MAG: malto-oligosyltrehalose synthase, partial [Pseudomonadota bacterium]